MLQFTVKLNIQKRQEGTGPFLSQEVIMYTLPVSGGPSFIVHALVALGALIVGSVAVLIKKIRRA